MLTETLYGRTAHTPHLKPGFTLLSKVEARSLVLSSLLGKARTDLGWDRTCCSSLGAAQVTLSSSAHAEVTARCRGWCLRRGISLEMEKVGLADLSVPGSRNGLFTCLFLTLPCTFCEKRTVLLVKQQFGVEHKKSFLPLEKGEGPPITLNSSIRKTSG